MLGIHTDFHYHGNISKNLYIADSELPEDSLEESFRLYHRGMDMLKECSDRIDRVEKEIQVLDDKGDIHELQE